MGSLGSGESIQSFLKKMGRPDVAELVQRMNHEYMHWDKVKHQPIPDDLTHEELWTAVALVRAPQFQELPLTLPGNRHLRFWAPPRHQGWLHVIDQDAGGLIGSRSKVVPQDDDDRFLFNSLMEEAIASSQLEGASTTRPIAKEMLRTKRKPRNRHEQMILNNYNAILEIRDMKHDPLTPEMLCKIQEVITDKTLDNPDAAGRFKNASDPPVEVIDTRTEEVLHTAPNYHDAELMIVEVCKFANTNQRTFIHPVIKAIVLHFMIAYIHPFLDGNGRTARAVFYWYMLKSGYWIFEYLPISRIVLDSMVSYGKAYLYTETDDFDLTYFTHYNLKIIDRAVREMHEYFSQQQSLMHQARKAVDKLGMNHRQANIAHEAIRDPNTSFTIKQHAGTHAIAPATARADLFGLEECGILTKRLVDRKFVFSPASHLKKRLRKGAFREVPSKLRNTVINNQEAVEVDNCSESELSPDTTVIGATTTTIKDGKPPTNWQGAP
jgi:Fic family protein